MKNFVLVTRVALLTALACGAWPGGSVRAEVDKGFHIKGALGYGYDDNLLYSHENEIDDFYSKVTLGIEYLLEQKTQSLETQIQAHRKFYSDHNELDYFSQDLNLIFKKELSKYSRFRIDEVFEHDEEATSFEDEFGREIGRYNTYKNNFRYELNKDLSPENNLTVSFANEAKEVERADLFDSIFSSIGLEVDHEWSPQTSAFLNYEFSHRYIDAPDNAFIQTLAPGLKRYLTPTLLFKTYAGVNAIYTYGNENLVRPTYYAALINELDETSTFKLAYQKAHITTGYTADVFDQWRAWMEYRKQLLARLNGHLKAFYGEGEYITQNIADKFTGVGLGFDYNLSKNWKASLSGSFARKDSDMVTREYTKTTAFLDLTFIF